MMHLKEQGEVTFPSVFDNTMMATFRSCHRKYFHEFLHHRAKFETSPDLHAGGAFAASIETVRKAYYEEHKQLSVALEDGFLTMAKFWGDYEPPQKKIKREGEFVLTDHVKNFVNMYSALEFYFMEAYPPAEDFLKPYWGKDSNVSPFEYTFCIPIPEVLHPQTGEPLLYAGRFDMIGAYNNAIFVVDEKTTGTFGLNWESQWEMRGQFIGYTWALRKTGIFCQGAVIRGIEILKTKFNFRESQQFYADWQIERWYKQLVRDLQKLVDCWNEGYWDFDYADGCTAFWGCDFMLLCTAEVESDWYGDYRERHWNPLELDPTESKKIVVATGSFTLDDMLGK